MEDNSGASTALGYQIKSQQKGQILFTDTLPVSLQNLLNLRKHSYRSGKILTSQETYQQGRSSSS